MIIFHHHQGNGKRLRKKPMPRRNLGMRLFSLLLCLSILTGFLPTLGQAENAGEKFSKIVSFDSITLHYADDYGQPGEPIQDNALIAKDKQLVLNYTYTIPSEQCNQIVAGTRYYLEVSPHLALPTLDESPLTIETDDGLAQRFGTINADGQQAWVVFDANLSDPNTTILSTYGGLENAFFYLNCNRADDPPESEPPLEGHDNLYALKFENDTLLHFGYMEREAISAKAQIHKDGHLEDKTITWTIDYTPWQNPSADDPVDANTSFELRDMIDTAVHSYIADSAKIDGYPITAYASRDDVPADKDAYVFIESPADSDNITLVFGGTKFKAGQATQGTPVTPLQITYQTSINDSLLLPGGTGRSKVTNAANLFAVENNVCNNLNISSNATVTIPQPSWLTKTGTTVRDKDGNGSITTWTVIFSPNGFAFEADNRLTLHDQLPAGSTLVADSVKIKDVAAAAVVGEKNDFTVSGIVTDRQNVTITYQTHVPETMYDNGTNLGSNVAWFEFIYNGSSYATPKTTTPIGSGDGSGTPTTSTLVKSNDGYNAATRMITWTVKINPHQAYLRSGTFTDDLKIVGGACKNDSHTSGLELLGGTNDIDIKVNGCVPTDDEKALIKLQYDQQLLTITVGEIGAKAITLTYTTKVCDPCIFANNTPKTPFTNTIKTSDMVLGRGATEKRSASSASTVEVMANVLDKKAPVYNYKTGIMEWTIQVNNAGLVMTDVVLTDSLPAGLTYVENSLTTKPTISNATVSTSGQELTLNLGKVTENTIITFNTRVDPETLGFGSDKPVLVENTVHMNGQADNVPFAEVSHRVEHTFSNHGLVKSSQVDNPQDLIQYEVLINPYHLALPETPSLVDTLDNRLQLDTDTLRFYEAELKGTTIKDQRPHYTKKGTGQPLKITDFDPNTNSFTVKLPIANGSSGTYVLTYTADILQRQTGGYGNSVHFEGGAVLLGGSKNNIASVGGGGGGGGVAARKAAIAITKTDSETQAPLAGVSFLLYQWDHDNNMRSLPFAQGKTDAQGKLSFSVKPGASYELVETESAPGYGSVFSWRSLPAGVETTSDGLLITAGAARSELKLDLTNEAQTTDIEFRLTNESGIPMAGESLNLYTSDPTKNPELSPVKKVAVSFDGTVKFSGIRHGQTYYTLLPGGGIMTIEIPAQTNKAPNVTLPDGTSTTLTADFRVIGSIAQEKQWTLTVNKVTSGSTIPLAGATIGLYADPACQSLIKTNESGQDGTMTFSGLLKGQSYWLKETIAPSNYQLDSTIYTAKETNPIVTIENIPKASPVNPDSPAGSGGGFGDSDNTDGSATSDISSSSGSSDLSPIPNDPSNSGITHAPSDSSNSNITHSPSDPTNSDISPLPSDPAFLDESLNSDASGAPDDPTASKKPDSESIDNHTNDTDIPQTGDNTLFLTVIALLSGSLLLVMMLCQLIGVQKREEQ